MRECKRSRVTCFACGGDHRVADCPDVKAVQQQKKTVGLHAKTSLLHGVKTSYDHPSKGWIYLVDDSGANRIIIRDKRLLKDIRYGRSDLAIGEESTSLTSEGIGRLVGRARDERGELVEIDLGEAEWCPTAIADIASTTTLFKMGVATIMDPYDERQKYMKMKDTTNTFVYIPLVEIEGSGLPAFEFLIEEHDIEEATVCMASMKALRESTEGASLDLIIFHRGLGGHAHEE